jgi:hypothetical protein
VLLIVRKVTVQWGLVCNYCLILLRFSGKLSNLLSSSISDQKLIKNLKQLLEASKALEKKIEFSV